MWFFLLIIIAKIVKKNLIYVISLLTIFFYLGVDQFFINTIFIDKIILALITLTLFIITHIVIINKHTYIYFRWLCIILILAFIRIRVIYFFIFFELSVLPIFIIVFYQGKQYERIKARLYLIFYTLFASFPFLLYILSFFVPIEMWIFNDISFFPTKKSLLTLFVFLSFLTKLPIFTLHLWLPKAHVEAPTYGSIILAGVILKLGIFGYYKYIIINNIKLYFSLYLRFVLVGALLSSIISLFSCDIKVLIAFSSVSHITFFISSPYLSIKEFITALIVLILSHGFISVNIFYVLGCSYNRVKRRSLYLNKMSNFSFFIIPVILFTVIRNFSSPPFVSIFRELLFFFSLFSHSFVYTFLVTLYIIYTIIYNLLFLYSFKNKQSSVKIYEEIKTREWVVTSSFIIYILLILCVLNFFH